MIPLQRFGKLSDIVHQVEISPENSSKRKILLEQAGELIGDLLIPDKELSITGTETTYEMNFAVFKIKRTVNIILAVPVAPPEVFTQFRHLTDMIVCLEIPTPFFAIGGWYENFPQTTDEEVIRLLNDRKS